MRIETNGIVFSCHTIGTCAGPRACPVACCVAAPHWARGAVGHGSFGVVFQALIDGTEETVAIKKVLQVSWRGAAPLCGRAGGRDDGRR